MIFTKNITALHGRISGGILSTSFVGDLTAIAGRRVVALTAENIRNLGGRIAGESVGLAARTDLANIGGSIEASDTLLASAGRDLTVASTTRTQTNARGSRTNLDRVAGLYVTGKNDGSGSGGTLVASAGNDLTLLAAALINSQPTAAGTPGTTILAAGHDLSLGTVTEAQNQRIVWNSKNRRSDAATRDVGTTIQSDGDLALSARHDVSAEAASVTSGGALTASAGNNLTLSTGNASLSLDEAHQHKSKGFLSKTTRTTRDTLDSTAALSSTFSGETVALSAGQDLTVKGSTVTAVGDLTASAGNDVIVDTAQDTSRETHFKSKKKSGFSASYGAISYGKSTLAQNTDGQTVTQVSSTLSGENVALTSGRDTVLKAATVLADRDLTVLAGRNLDLLAAAETQVVETHLKSTSSSIGFTPSYTGRFTGFSKTAASQDTDGSVVTQRTALLAANTGDLTLRAGLDPQSKGTGQGNLTTQGADLLAGDAITLSGNAIDLQAVANVSTSHSVEKTKSVTIGARPAGVIGEKIAAIGDAIERARDTDNDRLQGALALKAGYDAWKLSRGQDVPKTVPTGTETTPGSGGAAGGSGTASSGFGVSVSIGTSKSRSESSSRETSVSGTNLQAKTIDIAATESDLSMAAAKLQAEDIALTAKRDILLTAAANTSELTSKSSGRNTGFGVTFAFGGQQNGLSFQINAGQMKGQANGKETVWDNTLITASDSLSVRSGRNTALMGAQLAGDTITLDVGGNLLLQTLQDSSTYASKQTSSGINVSVCWFYCAGTPITGSIGGSAQSIKHTYRSAVGQSGIAAGDGGFDITVQQNTELIGAAITSSAGAEQNALTTASLTSRDLENVQRTKSSSRSLNLAYGGGSALTTAAGNVTSNVLGNVGSNAALPENRNERSATRSVISPATIRITGSGNTATDEASQTTADELTQRDPATANPSLKNTLSLQQAQVLETRIQEQKENQEAATLVGAELSNVVGDVAASQHKALQAQEDARAKAAGETPKTVTAWGDGSAEKIALHGLVGLIEAKIGDGRAAAGAFGGDQPGGDGADSLGLSRRPGLCRRQR